MTVIAAGPLAIIQSRRDFRYAVLAVLAIAGAWRAMMAVRMPVISRDGVTFCWYARELGRQGLAYLRTPEAQQHPLFPALMLGVQRCARLLGAPDTPMTWQRSGQLVCWLAGMAVVGLSGALAVRLVRRLTLPLDQRLVALLAMLAAALLDLNVWLSSDVMSDQVHLAFYLGAVLLLLGLDGTGAAVGCGLLSGLAFLTRQEGLLPAAAGLVVLAAQRRHRPWPRLAWQAAALLAGCLLLTVPYWLTVGRFSTKKDVFQWFRTAPALQPAPSRSALTPVAPEDPSAVCRKRSAPAGCEIRTFALGKLEPLDLPWYALLPHAVYKLFRAGRVVIPLLALFPLLTLRRRLLSPILVGWTCCLAGHFSLTLGLLAHNRYLDPRHMLVPTLLLLPLAAMLLARAMSLLLELRKRWGAGLLATVCGLPLVWYSLRVPNAREGFLADAAHWLTTHDPQVAARRLLCGSGPKRIAFYADMRWDHWAERPEDYPVLCSRIRTGGPGYLALEVGPGFEHAGNRELVDRLRADAQLKPYLGAFHLRPGPDPGTELYLIELHPQDSGG